MRKQFISCTILVLVSLLVLFVFGCQSTTELVKPIPAPAKEPESTTEPEPESEAELTPAITGEETKPPPTAEEEQAPVPANIPWGKWGLPIWGPEYKATTKETILIFYKNSLFVKGKPLPKDKNYYLWYKVLKNTKPIQDPREVIFKYKPGIDDIGGVVTREGEHLITIKTVGYVKGEPLQSALISDDKTVMLFAKEIPYPIESKQGDYRIFVELASPEGNTFIVWGEGFEPGEEISTTSSSDGEIIKSKVKANSEGKFMTVVLPAVVGKEDGLATFSAAGKSSEVEVSYQWGPPALKSPDSNSQ